MISWNPGAIIWFAQYLKTSNLLLNDVVTQQEKTIKELEDKKGIEGDNVDEGEFTWVME